MVNERHNKILTLLEEQGAVSLRELITECDVSEATVRRDLTLLEQKNLLYRTHGGAVRKNVARGDEEALVVKRSENVHAKREIAAYIGKNIIETGQTIYLDAGSSTYELIDFLRDRKVTVVTNSTYHLARLTKNKIHTIILGGTVKHSTQAVVGHSALRQLENYSFDMCFIGCNGIDETFGITTADENEAFIKQVALQNSKKKYVLADESKFAHRKFQKFANMQEVVIVTYDAPEQYKKHDNVIIVKHKEEK